MLSFSHLIALFIPKGASALPFNRPIDPSSDAWATSLSDVGPLILLIGERSTKQLLRNVRGFASAFSLAAAPLGLVSVVSSLLRLEGSQRIRSFLGYELESRTVAALELTRVNCNGIHAELVDGFLVRSTAALSDSHVGVLGILAMEGKLSEHASEAVNQIRSCHEFEVEKLRLKVPQSDGTLQWCMRSNIDRWDEKLSQKLIQILAAGLRLSRAESGLDVVMEYWREYLLKLDEATGKSEGTKSEGTLSLLCTFDSVSEFSTSSASSQIISAMIGVGSSALIIALYGLELWLDLHWSPTIGYLLTLIGYLGIVCSVLAASLRIQRATQTVILENPSARNTLIWRDGLVVAAASDDKNGAVVYHPQDGRSQSYESVRLKRRTRHSILLADGIGLILTLSFVCHYLGLRSSSWWLGGCELAICITSALLRSLSREGPSKFAVGTDGTPGYLRIDWRCVSTGILTVFDPQRLPFGVQPEFGGLEVRMYSEIEIIAPPVAAEKVALCLSDMCIADAKVLQWLKRITGMQVCILKNSESADKRAVVVSYHGGILVKQGLASLAVCATVAFISSIQDLSTPTALLVRGIMRQPSWMVGDGFAETISLLSNVYVPPIEALLTWWTVAELRNGIKDYRENLQWSLLLLTTCFFAILKTDFNQDQELVNGLSEISCDADPQSLATNIFENFLIEAGARESVRV